MRRSPLVQPMKRVRTLRAAYSDWSSCRVPRDSQMSRNADRSLSSCSHWSSAPGPVSRRRSVLSAPQSDVASAARTRDSWRGAAIASSTSCSSAISVDCSTLPRPDTTAGIPSARSRSAMATPSDVVRTRTASWPAFQPAASCVFMCRMEAAYVSCCACAYVVGCSVPLRSSGPTKSQCSAWVPSSRAGGPGFPAACAGWKTMASSTKAQWRCRNTVFTASTMREVLRWL